MARPSEDPETITPEERSRFVWSEEDVDKINEDDGG